MNLTEDDTFNRLKSLTESEAQRIFYETYIQVLQDLGDPSSGVPMEIIKPLIDRKLYPYGWSVDRLFKMNVSEFS